MTKRYVSLVLCLGLLFLAGCDDLEGEMEVDAEVAVATAVSQPRTVSQTILTVSNDSFEPDECPFTVPSGYEIECGYLIVPEDRSWADSPMIELAVAIIYSSGGGQEPPIVYLAGGPGSSALDEFVSDPEGWAYPFLETRDLILIDQRGTGYSFPTLDCPELEDADFTQGDPERECHARLVAEGIDLSAYNSAENAADIADLRLALGYEEWNLLGISYGTRLALAVMRDRPEGIRSVLLDSPFPPNVDTPGEEALNVWESLQTLFTDCQADAYCDETYPDLEAVFLETVAGLNEAPVDDLFGDDFFFAITEALNDTFSIPLLPYVIYAVYDGEYDALDEISQDSGYSRRYQAEPDRSDSEGMYNSVICRDEYAFGTYEAAEARLTAVAPPEVEAALLRGVYELFQTCDYWGAGRAGAVEEAAVVSDIPTLILAGQYDHATPARWARVTAQTLSRSYLFEIPGAGHSLISSDECAIDLVNQFFDDPWTAPNDDCLDGIEWPYFE